MTPHQLQQLRAAGALIVDEPGHVVAVFEDDAGQVVVATLHVGAWAQTSLDLIEARLASIALHAAASNAGRLARRGGPLDIAREAIERACAAAEPFS